MRGVLYPRSWLRRRWWLLGLFAVAALAVLCLGGGRAQAALPVHPVVVQHRVATSAISLTADRSPRPIEVGPTLPGGSATPSPPSTSTGSGTSTPGCGLLDISCHITSAIDGWFKDLATEALNPVLSLLGRSVLATPNLTAGRLGQLWGVMAGIANALMVLLVLAGGAVVMGHESLQTRYGLKEVLPRIVVGIVAANASLSVAHLATVATNSLAQAVLGQGVDPASATQALQKLVVAPLGDGSIAVVLLGVVVAVLALVLLATYVVRVAVTGILIVAAPLALVCHALPQAEGAARLWWRAFLGVFAIQLAQSLVLVTALRVFLASDGSLGLSGSGGLVDLLIGSCLLWVLIRIPAWVSRAVFSGRRGGSGVLRTAVLYKAVRAGMAAL